MKVILRNVKDPHSACKYWSLTIGREYQVIGIEAESYRIIDDTGDPVLFDPVCFDVADQAEPSFWQSQIGEEGERYAYPSDWMRPGFFEDYHDRVKEVRRQFWQDCHRLYGIEPPALRTTVWKRGDLTHTRVKKLDEANIRRDYPIAAGLNGWYFRLTEVSACVWRGEGADLWGRQVSASGTDEEIVLKECIKFARRIEQRVRAHQQD